MSISSTSEESSTTVKLGFDLDVGFVGDCSVEPDDCFDDDLGLFCFFVLER